jgi:hypothetical protein
VVDISGGGEDDLVENKFNKFDLSASQTNIMYFEKEYPHKKMGNSMGLVQ